jgi:transposase-like protein
VTTVDTHLQETITMGSTRRKFTPEYKAEAVQFVISSGKPMAEVARNLGIVEGTLGNWVARARENGEAKDPIWMFRSGPSCSGYARKYRP